MTPEQRERIGKILAYARAHWKQLVGMVLLGILLAKGVPLDAAGSRVEQILTILSALLAL